MNGACTRCGTLLTDDACAICVLNAPLPKVRIDDSLELGDLLGEGGMGAVFEAYDRILERHVAAKFLPPNIASDEDAKKRLAREAQILAALNHPNIVDVYSLGWTESQPFVLMERVDGQALTVGDAPWTPQKLLPFAKELCDALAHAHRVGIVHRDIKPSNILLDAKGHVKVTDFGIAKQSWQPGHGVAQSPHTAITAVGGVVGTPEFMAPESLTGSYAGAGPSPTLDVYSVGVVLYLLLTGELPRGSLRPLPGGWDVVIRTALAPDPSHRYQDAGAMRKALDGLDTSASANHLPPEQLSFMRAVALGQSVASAVFFWALFVSTMPKMITAESVQPLVMFVGQPLSDGRVISWARFEVLPILFAALAIALAILAHGLLRRHWRLHGWLQRDDSVRINSARALFVLGCILTTTYLVHRFALDGIGGLQFLPVLGGLSELAAVWLFWITVLHLQRLSRPLLREWRLWAGAALALIPPVSDFLRYLFHWQPPV